MQIFYVYVHRRASDNSIFYIGKGKDRRAWDKSSRNPHWKRIASKHGLIVEVIKDGLTECCALTLEKIAISKFGIDNLANFTFGGGGTSGFTHSDETKKKISDAGKGRPFHPNSAIGLRARRGCEFSNDHKAKLSAARSGRKFGPRSDETKDKISKSHIGIRPSIETLSKMSASKIGKRKREENNKFDPTLRVFEHPEHGVFVGCTYDLRNKYKIGASCVTSIVNGSRITARGWRYNGEN